MQPVQNQPTFAPFSASPKLRDLAASPWEQQIVAHLVTRFWDLDFEKVVISGYADDRCPNRVLNVVVYDGGEIIQDVRFEGAYQGLVHIRPKEGVAVKAALRRDLITQFTETWLAASGYAPGFPCGVECTVTGNSIEIAVCPSI